MLRLPILISAILLASLVAQAQNKSRPEPIPARKQFGFVLNAAPLKPHAIGFYTKGCLAGGVQLPVDGPAWQAMRLSRNRNWGHPTLVRYVKRLAKDAQKLDGWPGLLVGDLAQPRGGPMLSGHRSHQVGLDADIWLTPMPKRRLSYNEREQIAATSMLASKTTLNHWVWSKAHVRLLKRAVSYSEVERIFVHPAIKKGLCDAAGDDKKWLAKIRPYWGHYYHFHVRIRCPAGSKDCRPQAPAPRSHKCGKELKNWIALLNRPTAPPKPRTKKRKPRPPLTLAGLPKGCTRVLAVDRPPLLAATAPIQEIVLPRRRPRRSAQR